MDGVEVDKPALEEGLGYLFEGLVGGPVEGDLVVEGREDGGDFLLLGEGWE